MFPHSFTPDIVETFQHLRLIMETEAPAYVKLEEALQLKLTDYAKTNYLSVILEDELVETSLNECKAKVNFIL